jgi:choline dehydrogenase-like flavoprotein
VRYDVLILGGGSAGCVLAARLSEEEARSVCLVEAGPDYGPFDAGRWPEDLLDPGDIPDLHEWDADESPFSPLRARVLSGCSAHNAALLVRPPAADLDTWGGGWSDDELDRYVRRALETMAPHPFLFTPDTFSPWFSGIVEAGTDLGLPLLGDANDAPEALGIALGPFNLTNGVRWNAAFAYLDPARPRPNLTIRANTLVDRVLFDGERAVAAVADDEILQAEVVVLAAGACGSPAILLRSGVGPEADLDALGIDIVVANGAVGANLADHVSAKLAFAPSDRLREETERRAPVQFSNGVVRAATGLRDDAFDVHLLPVTSRTGESAHITVAAMQPASRGHVRLGSSDPAVSPEIDHRLLSDPDGVDRKTLLAGLALAHRLAATEPLGRLGRPVELPDEERIDTTLGIYFHPVGTCALGSVVESDGRVRGVENLYVADASVMPSVPRANTHLATLAIAEKLAETI